MTTPRLYARKRIDLEIEIAQRRIAFQEMCFGNANREDVRGLARLQAERRLTFTRLERFRAWVKGVAL